MSARSFGNARGKDGSRSLQVIVHGQPMHRALCPVRGQISLQLTTVIWSWC